MQQYIGTAEKKSNGKTYALFTLGYRYLPLADDDLPNKWGCRTPKRVDDWGMVLYYAINPKNGKPWQKSYIADVSEFRDIRIEK